MAFLAALTSALFLEVLGRLRASWWICLALAAVAMALVFRRRAIVIDPERRRVTLISRWFLPVTIRRAVSVDRLTVRMTPASGDSGRPTVWLEDAQGPSFRVDLNSAENPEETARRLSADLGRPLVVDLR